MNTLILTEFTLPLPWFCDKVEQSFANRIMGNTYSIENEAVYTHASPPAIVCKTPFEALSNRVTQLEKVSKFSFSRLEKGKKISFSSEYFKILPKVWKFSEVRLILLSYVVYQVPTKDS